MSVAEPLVQASLLGEAIDPGPVAILVADEEGRYVAANQFACDLLGYTREELLRLNVEDVARNGKRDYREMLERSRWQGIATVTRKDGTAVEMRFSARETRVAGMPVYVSVGWPATE
jgi:PAS domain S-box-containing protein